MHLKKTLSRQRIYEILELASEGDKVSRYVDIGLIALILLSVIAIVLESVQAINDRYYSLFYWFEVISVSVFTIEYILRIWTCVESPKNLAIKYSGLTSRIRYQFSITAIVDLLAILPFYLVMFGIFGNVDMRFLRSFRLLRILKLTRYSAAFDVLINVFKENARAFGAAFFVLMVVMLLAATGMYYFERETQPVAFGSILSSMWWAFATLTTVGYGDVTPITAGGKVFGVLITVLGVGMVALPAGILASAFSEQLRIRSSKYANLADQAYEDGIVTADEKASLEKLREELGIGKIAAEQILLDEKQKLKNIKLSREKLCPHCGESLIASREFATNTLLAKAG